MSAAFVPHQLEPAASCANPGSYRGLTPERPNTDCYLNPTEQGSYAVTSTSECDPQDCLTNSVQLHIDINNREDFDHTKRLMTGDIIRINRTYLRVIAYLGRGGLAHVYKVQLNQERLLNGNNPIYLTLKVLHKPMPSAADSESALNIEWFQNAVEIRYRFRDVLDGVIPKIMGFVGNCLVLEYVDGNKPRHPYDSWGKEESKRVTFGRQIIEHLLPHLDQLSSNKIAHRDIKPENIIVNIDEAGNIIKLNLIDADLMKEIDPDKRLNKIPGTPQYISPEMACGEIDPTGDMFAAGVMALEYLDYRVPQKLCLKPVSKSPFSLLKYRFNHYADEYKKGIVTLLQDPAFRERKDAYGLLLFGLCAVSPVAEDRPKNSTEARRLLEHTPPAAEVVVDQAYLKALREGTLTKVTSDTTKIPFQPPLLFERPVAFF